MSLLKLHLGCGERYLDGYKNVDFPANEHSVQTKRVADEYVDILTLRYPAESIEEIRLHHVFEHFTRPIACALLSCWFSWLKPRGLLRIEVPDFQKTAWMILRPAVSLRRRLIAERHLFGTHEADWAIHCDGYTNKILKSMVEIFGYRVSKIIKNSWMSTYNLELFAIKKEEQITRLDFENIAEKYLRTYLLDGSETEKRLLKVWMSTFKKQIEASWAQSE